MFHKWLRRQSLAFVTLIFSAVFFLSAANVDGLWTASRQALPLLAGSQQAVEAFGASDAGSYLQVAIRLQELGIRGAEGYFWVFNLWAPGMVFLDLVIVLLEEWTRIPYMLLTVLVASLVWGFTLGSLFEYVRARSSAIAAVGISAFVLLSSLVSPFGTTFIAFADGYAACAAVLSVLYLARASEQKDRAKKFKFWSLSIFALAFAVHMRSVYETVTVATFLLASIGLSIVFLVHKFRRLATNFRLIEPFWPLFLVSTLTLLLTVPWRLVAGLWIRPGDFSWSVSTSPNSYIWTLRWMPDKYLEDQGMGWLVGTGVNYACKVDSSRCIDIFDSEMSSEAPYSGGDSGFHTYPEFFSLLVTSVVEYPVGYLLDRLAWFFAGFFSKTGSNVGDPAIPEALILLIGAIVIAFVVALRPSVFSAPFAFGLVQTLVMSAVLLVIHMETRYMAGIKMTIIVLFALSIPHLKEIFGKPKTPDIDSVGIAWPKK